MHLAPRTGTSKHHLVNTAAAMYAGAALIVLAQALTANGPATEFAPGLVAFAMAVLLFLIGPRLPFGPLFFAGPIGAGLVAIGLATTPGAGDGAALYAWPVLWVAYFFGRVETVLIIVWVGLVHALALLALAPGDGYFDRWIDVMVSVSVVGAVVQALSHRNEDLLRRLSAQARIDSLTGILNRRGFDERAPLELARASRDDTPIALVSLDIDHFKRVNDQHGHDAGDRVLVRLGEIFREQGRGTDLVARVGGEEFTALLRPADADQARAYAERVRTAFAGLDDLGFPVTISAGIAASPPSSRQIEALLAQADAALYEAKVSGRNRTVVHDEPVRSLAIG